MRHVSVMNIRNVIKLDCDVFEKIINELFNNEVQIEYDLEDSGWYAIWRNDDEKEFDENLIYKKLTRYFDVKITEIITDNFVPCHFWICYQN